MRLNSRVRLEDLGLPEEQADRNAKSFRTIMTVAAVIALAAGGALLANQPEQNQACKDRDFELECRP